ncbi:hypothetical protein SAMN04515691_2459 [Leifsonia sp. 98AMF]|uniref:DUF6792 domain-containing protein n=1 Tax=unclassified Leifsonia TaxID=2663824 RepID=UPI00087A6F59|nr:MULTISPECIES: DUF6792 domain-containing protein [unclassified Leifsonia]SDH26852.1 hypothetical protein SAMN04515690_1558 [Leifsonia sp. 197AMF]SDJ11771.1 hypothetical protein SAMN04515684_2226 [Leifsonia sp. 466MF]SDJ57954.1 hypothetical protein SAMN04515683_0519 [Leifsonia sp. 157MF]SDN33196.1 hypothetical protein SAMN04515686_0409 [Leifsonia sp. 509MF]SEM88392.1 hypothetical protein SAMN04515685_0507 [Leifsonia sp. 467MF]
MTTQKEDHDIAKEAYLVDPLARDPPYTAGSRFKVGPDDVEYLVYDSHHDPVSGFQGMAVVPVVAGKPDFSHVTIAFAGTNPEHRADILADTMSVVGGDTGPGTQASEAMEFARRVRESVKKEHPEASYSTVGHSLGGWQAMLVAAEFGWAGVSFNGPDPWDSLSPRAKEWLQRQRDAGRNPMVNYVNEWDLIGNLSGNGTGAAKYVGGPRGKGPFGHHDLETAYEFNADGSLKRLGVEGRSDWEISQNQVAGLPAGLQPQFTPIIAGLYGRLRLPLVGEVVGTIASGATVLVDTVAALDLASSIGSLGISLEAIKAANAGLPGQLQSVLDAGRSTVSMIPFVTPADVEECISTHRLNPHQRIDLDAVAEVDRRVDTHTLVVAQLSEGVVKAVVHTLEQDGQWASRFSPLR